MSIDDIFPIRKENFKNEREDTDYGKSISKNATRQAKNEILFNYFDAEEFRNICEGVVELEINGKPIFMDSITYQTIKLIQERNNSEFEDLYKRIYKNE